MSKVGIVKIQKYDKTVFINFFLKFLGKEKYIGDTPFAIRFTRNSETITKL
jgi:hypothetical protein